MIKKRLRHACMRAVSAFIDATNPFAFFGDITIGIYADKFMRAGFI